VRIAEKHATDLRNRHLSQLGLSQLSPNSGRLRTRDVLMTRISQLAISSNWRIRLISRRGFHPPIGVRLSITTWARAGKRGPAWPRSAARNSGRGGRRPRVRSGGSARFRTTSKAVQPIRWGRARSTCMPTARTRCIRIHGTNQPGWIGHAISSGCIRLTNEDVIDLYSRVKTGATVVVLGPNQGGSRLASASAL
jgi:hypothetical protein